MCALFPFGKALVLPAILMLAAFSRCDNEPSGPPGWNPADSTTHDWRFEIDTLGDRNSYANKIAAFGPDDVWVTGKFLEYPDPSHPWDSKEYNVAHWDGKKWNFEPVGTSGAADGYSILAFQNDYFRILLLATRNGFYMNDGNNWQRITISPNGAITAGLYGLWGKDERDFHIIGKSGTWTKWDGRVNGWFSSFSTPTTVDLTDIYGDGDVIYACGVDAGHFRSVLLRYNLGNIEVVDSCRELSDPRITSVWYSERDDVLAVCGDWQRFQHNGWHTADSNWPSIPWCHQVRGSGLDNIWWVGQRMYLLHYNGNTWRQWRDYFPNQGELKGIAVGKHYFFASGVQFVADGWPRGIVIRGYPVK